MVSVTVGTACSNEGLGSEGMHMVPGKCSNCLKDLSRTPAFSTSIWILTEVLDVALVPMAEIRAEAICTAIPSLVSWISATL